MSVLYEFCKVEEYFFCDSVLKRIQAFSEKQIKNRKDSLSKTSNFERASILFFDKCLPRGRFLIHKCAELVESVKSVSVGTEPDRRVVIYLDNTKDKLISDQSIRKRKTMSSKDNRIEQKRPDKEIFVPRYRRMTNADYAKVLCDEDTSTSDHKVINTKETLKCKEAKYQKEKRKRKGKKKENSFQIFKDDTNTSVCEITHLVKSTDHLENVKNDRGEEFTKQVSVCEGFTLLDDVSYSNQFIIKPENEVMTSLSTECLNYSSTNNNDNKISLKHSEINTPSEFLDDLNSIASLFLRKATFIDTDSETLKLSNHYPTHITDCNSITLVDVIQELINDILSVIENLQYNSDIFDAAVSLCQQADIENEVNFDNSIKTLNTSNDCNAEVAINNDSQKDISDKSLNDFSAENVTKSNNSKQSESIFPPKINKKAKKLKKNIKKHFNNENRFEQEKLPCDKIATTEDQDKLGNDWDANWTEDGNCLSKDILEFSSLTGINDPMVEDAQIIDYLHFSTKEIILDDGEFGHIVELFDFSPVLKSQDIFNVLKSAGINDYNITWVDDTHALAVFSSQKAAHEAIKSYSPILQMRQVINGTRQSKLKARELKDVLLPFKKRPPTTGSVARNLISGALGIKSNLSLEQKAKERELLNEAREQKRLKAKKLIEVWEGD